MELTAAIKTLEKLKNFQLKENFKLRTDSKYVIEGYTKWIINWKKNGWKTSSGKAVQNLDLWQKIDDLRIKGLEMEFVKGHNGDRHNERVDLIATSYSKGISLVSEIKKSILESDFSKEKGPSEIQKLFSKNELIEKFAEKKYFLNSNELNELLGEESYLFVKKHELFEWRNWTLIPKNQQYWIIENKNT